MKDLFELQSGVDKEGHPRVNTTEGKMGGWKDGRTKGRQAVMIQGRENEKTPYNTRTNPGRKSQGKKGEMRERRNEERKEEAKKKKNEERKQKRKEREERRGHRKN
jgi:hypothetical protein